MARMVLAFLALLALHGPAEAQERRVITDGAGRRVAMPTTRIDRITPAGPPAAVLLYTLYPETMIGWIRAPGPAELAFLDGDAARIGTVPRLTGRNAPDEATIRAARPELIIDYGTIDPTYAALADRVQASTGVPYLLLDGSLRAIPQTYRVLRELLGDRALRGHGSRAEELAADAERILQQASTAATRRGGGRAPRVYYGRGADGLAAVRAGTISAEVLAFMGATNVVDIANGPPFPRVTIEQIAAWNPDIVIFAQHEAFAAATSDAGWQRVAAVREHRVYAAPALPFGFVEEPPSVNRLIGLPWLGAVLYPDVFDRDPRARIGAFYTLFYRRAPTDADLTTVLRDALPM
jgi:iron complex transport system substrate-binding protein